MSRLSISKLKRPCLLPSEVFLGWQSCSILLNQNTTAVGNVKIALPENIALLLHPHVDVPWSLVVT